MAETKTLIAAPRLPYHTAIEEKFGVDSTGWRALVDAIFPAASSTDSVVMALSYCKARGLDPFKRCVHIVPIWSKDRKCMVDSVWPGIGELRTTAFRTGNYAGKDPTEFGADVAQKIGAIEVTYPEFAQVTLYRLIGGQRVSFTGPKVFWVETYGQTKRDDATPNEMWRTRPRGQLEKCAEAAALRCAFPEEIGNELISDEVSHQEVVQTTAQQQWTMPTKIEQKPVPQLPAPASTEPNENVLCWTVPIGMCQSSAALEKLHSEFDGSRERMAPADVETVEAAFAARLEAVP